MNTSASPSPMGRARGALPASLLRWPVWARLLLAAALAAPLWLLTAWALRG